MNEEKRKNNKLRFKGELMRKILLIFIFIIGWSCQGYASSFTVSIVPAIIAQQRQQQEEETRKENEQKSKLNTKIKEVIDSNILLSIKPEKEKHFIFEKYEFLKFILKDFGIVISYYNGFPKTNITVYFNGVGYSSYYYPFTKEQKQKLIAVYNKWR